MEKARIMDMKKYSLVAVMMATAILTACSGDDNIISEPAARTFTLTVNASKGDDAVTRALSLDGSTLNATWTAGDAVTVYNVTKSAALTGTLIAQSDGVSTILRGSLTGTIETNDELELRFLSPAYSSQDGTLETIAATCDYAVATVTVNDASTSPMTTSGDAIFYNQQAIVKFILQDKATDNPVYATQLTVNAGATTINVTPVSATDLLYVAIPGITSQTVSLSATAGGINYIYEKTGVTLVNSQYYGFTVSMQKFVAPLTFEAKEPGVTVTFTKGTSVANQIEYSTDGGTTWATYSDPITLINVGDKVYFRGNNTAYGTSDIAYSSRFSCSDECYVYGNIMSLINSTGYDSATELTGDYAFANLFSNNSNIYYHPTKKLELPATTLTTGCYESMFSGCTSLTVAPVLPATSLSVSCYESMFSGCTSLTTTPQLSATTLASSCYESMFSGCTSLSTKPELSATVLASSCYKSMFSGCTSLSATPELSATTLASSCYESMFMNCTSLSTAPATLSATTLTESCYKGMFYGCTSLTAAPALPATSLSISCYESMFRGCISLTTPPALSATTLASSCYSGMFWDCTSLTTAPVLSATTLYDGCYSFMFLGCTNLTTAPALPATTLAKDCYGGMFQICTSLTEAPDLPATTLVDGCYNGMFRYSSNLNSVRCLATDISAINCTSYWLDGVSATGTFTKVEGVDWSGKIPGGWTVMSEFEATTSADRQDYGNKETDTWN